MRLRATFRQGRAVRGSWAGHAAVHDRGDTGVGTWTVGGGVVRLVVSHRAVPVVGAPAFAGPEIVDKVG
jgi:hypothetical protein